MQEDRDEEDRRAYDLKARVDHARKAVQRSYRKHARNIMAFGRLTVMVSTARLAAIHAPERLPRLRVLVARRNRAIAAGVRSVHAMGEARERLDIAVRNWGDYRRSYPPGHVFTFPARQRR